jgi:hypothetical protein
MRRYEVNIVLNPNLDQSQLALEKEIIQRALRQATALCKTIGRIERVARRIKRMIERALSLGEGARNSVRDYLAK